ncbi:hypothetical protein ACWGR4_12690 [Embleya sp. NPDC055664]
MAEVGIRCGPGALDSTVIDHLSAVSTTTNCAPARGICCDAALGSLHCSARSSGPPGYSSTVQPPWRAVASTVATAPGPVYRNTCGPKPSIDSSNSRAEAGSRRRSDHFPGVITLSRSTAAGPVSKTRTLPSDAAIGASYKRRPPADPASASAHSVRCSPGSFEISSIAAAPGRGKITSTSPAPIP